MMLPVTHSVFGLLCFSAVFVNSQILRNSLTNQEPIEPVNVLQICDSTPTERQRILRDALSKLQKSGYSVGRKGSFAAYGGHFSGANPEVLLNLNEVNLLRLRLKNPLRAAPGKLRNSLLPKRIGPPSDWL